MIKKILNLKSYDCSEVSAPMSHNHMVKIYILLSIVFLLFSCSSIPFANSRTGSEAVKKTDEMPSTKNTAKGERITDSSVPQPGDIKVIDGVEYIYASNVRYMYTPSEPEYKWIRKDQYAPRIGENLVSVRMPRKEKEELENRISKLEEDLKRKGIAPQIAYPSQTVSLPASAAGNATVPVHSDAYLSPKMKRRVIVLPIADETSYREQHLVEAAAKRFISRLESTNAIICIDPETLNVKGQLTDPENMKILNEVYSIQAVLKGTIYDASKTEGKNDFNMRFLVYDTETGNILKQLSGRSTVFFSKENEDLGSEKAKTEDASIELIADDLLKSVLTIDWHARITSIENGKVYINAGRLSGLENGATLEVYSPGALVIDLKTNMPLGRVRGSYKGELQVSEVFGIDASVARFTGGNNCLASDLVYVKKN